MRGLQLALPLGHPPGIEFLIKRAPLIGQLVVGINEFIGKSCYGREHSIIRLSIFSGRILSHDNSNEKNCEIIE